MRANTMSRRGRRTSISAIGTTRSKRARRAISRSRLGFRQIDGFREEWAETLTSLRGTGFPDIETFARRTGLPRRALELLADADACRSIGMDRREALWAVRRLPGNDALPLFAHADAAELAVEPAANLPLMPLAEHVVTDYQTMRLSLKAHPMSFLRARLRAEGIN